MTTVNRREYGKALSTYGFNYHNVIRYRRDSGIDKVSKRQVDWYMNNLLKRPRHHRLRLLRLDPLQYVCTDGWI